MGENKSHLCVIFMMAVSPPWCEELSLMNLLCGLNMLLFKLALLERSYLVSPTTPAFIGLVIWSWQTVLNLYYTNGTAFLRTPVHAAFPVSTSYTHICARSESWKWSGYHVAVHTTEIILGFFAVVFLVWLCPFFCSPN